MEGEEGQVKGKRNPSSALPTTGIKASVRPDYVNLSEYPPGTGAQEDHRNSAASSSGINRPCVDHPSSASATAASSGPKASNRLPKVPPETAAAYAEVIGLKPELIHAFPDAYAYHVYPGRYGHYVEGRRIVVKLEKWAGFTFVPYKVPKPEVGFFVPKHDDPSAGAKVEGHVSPTAS